MFENPAIAGGISHPSFMAIFDGKCRFIERRDGIYKPLQIFMPLMFIPSF